MPPLATWYTPRDDDRDVGARVLDVGRVALAGGAHAAPTPSRRSAFYAWDEAAGAYLPFALNVLSLRDGLVSDVTAFIVRSTDSAEPEAYDASPSSRWTTRRLAGTFERFGLPDSLN